MPRRMVARLVAVFRHPWRKATGLATVAVPLALAAAMLAACGARPSSPAGAGTAPAAAGPAERQADPAQGVLGADGSSIANPLQSMLYRLMVATHRPPLAPVDLSVTTATGQEIAPGAWTNQGKLQLRATLRSPHPDAVLQLEIELRPVDEPFTGVPNVTGRPGASVTAVPPLEDGRRYHWQARAREVGGRAGPWAIFDGTFGYAATPPPAPQFDPLPDGKQLGQREVRITWHGDGGAAGLAGYAYAFGRQPNVPLPEQPNANEPAATLVLPDDGTWYVRVRALDRAGNWSEPATLSLHVDTAPPVISDVLYRTFAYNPAFGTLPISFRLSKPAEVVVRLLPVDSNEPVRTYHLGSRTEGVQEVRLEWDGKDETGSLVPPGAYRFRVTATDRFGHTADAIYRGLLVTQKRIVISLSRQELWAYDGDEVVLSTLVTTGGPELPTPTGTFQILAKYSPFTFHSPWPKGSPYWYPDSPTTYAMLFDEGGYFIHDAPWRTHFGPGSNTTAGTPGGNETGTHGCVNVPLGVQARLFAWTDLGTPVVVQW